MPPNHGSHCGPCSLIPSPDGLPSLVSLREPLLPLPGSLSNPGRLCLVFLTEAALHFLLFLFVVTGSPTL